MDNLLEELKWRGLLHQCTNESTLLQHLSTPGRKAYAGFDPTADSLTIGNLVPLMVLRHFQRAGHAPVVLLGGGTGLIGDPSGKSAERPLLDSASIERNVASQRTIFEGVLDFEGEAAALVVNNADWLSRVSYLELLRDVGKHFSVNMMMQKDSVRERLKNREQGISYTEFSYMILQAYDFLHLRRTHQVTLQLGGSDQWGNIVAGVDLTRRLQQAEVFGLTAPLVTKADGSKFGKTESGAVWLTAARTSPYAYYQFWLNTADADVERYIKMFTLLTRTKIDEILDTHAAAPERRQAQRALAEQATELLHGADGLARAQSATEALFSGHFADLDKETLEMAVADAPSSEHDRNALQQGMTAVDLVSLTTLATSKRQAREFLKNGAISVNGQKLTLESVVSQDTLLHKSLLLTKRGKKNWHVLRFS